MNNKMKFRKIKLIAIGIISLFFIVFAWYLIDRFSYANKQTDYQVNEINQDTVLTFGIIGDSWVAGHKLDSLLHQELLENGINNKIISSGHPGAKSKLIYQNLFKNKDIEHSSKFIIESNPDYCIVIAGVNDEVGQIGKEFYAHHMIMIIETLLHHQIKPIIVELPEVGIEEATNQMGFIKKYRNMTFAYFNNNGEIDNTKTYRENLNVELEKKELDDEIIFIDFDKVCAEYSNCKELYGNHSHLSKKGNGKLCKIIVEEIKKQE